MIRFSEKSPWCKGGSGGTKYWPNDKRWGKFLIWNSLGYTYTLCIYGYFQMTMIHFRSQRSLLFLYNNNPMCNVIYLFVGVCKVFCSAISGDHVTELDRRFLYLDFFVFVLCLFCFCPAIL